MDTKEARLHIVRSAARDAGKEALRGSAVYAVMNIAQIPKSVAAAIITVLNRTVEETEKLRVAESTRVEWAEAVADICLSALIATACAELAKERIKSPVLASILGSSAGVFLYQLVKTPVKLAVDALPHGETARV